MLPDIKQIHPDFDVASVPKKRRNIRRTRTVINGSLRWRHTRKLRVRQRAEQFKASVERAVPVLKQLLGNQENHAPSRLLSEALADQMFDVLKGAQFAKRWCLCDGR